MSAGSVFQTKRANRVKLVFWEGSGVGLHEKPVEGAESHWRIVDQDEIQLARAQLSALFEGLDWRHARKLAVGASAASRGDRRARG